MGEKMISTVDANDIPTESRVVTIRVKGRNVYRAVFDKVKEAFDKEGKNSSWAVVEKGTEGMEVDSATMHDLGLTRQLWSVWREGADAILVGNMKNSTYRLLNFDDKQHSGYRTCCAAEWSKSDVPDVYTAQLVYVYGRKPESAMGEKPKRSVNIMRSFRSPADAIEWTRQWPLPDSATIGNIMKRFDNQDFTKMKSEDIDNLMKQAQQLQQAYGNNANPTDIPFDGNKDTWMALAMQRGVGHLSNADWHRFFGLLTEKMMDRSNRLDKGAKDDMVVAAGLILDLCKNAPLDDDEREVAANRLIQVSETFDDDKNQYIHDMIMLAKKKVEKK